MSALENLFSTDSQSAFDAKCEAQRIAFAPVVFQACRTLRQAGILELVQRSGTQGLGLAEIVAGSRLPRYGVKVLMESGLGIGLFCLNAGRFTLTKLGYFILRDPMTQVNMDLMQDICYRGLFHLDEAVATGKPAGLKTLGDWPTFYEGLAALPENLQRSWFAFDHYYSDEAFPAALPLVFADKPKRLLDVGGNTGRWALQCLRHDPDVRLMLAAAAKAHTKLPLSETHQKILSAAEAAGLGQLDNSAIIRVIGARSSRSARTRRNGTPASDAARPKTIRRTRRISPIPPAR